MTKFTLTVTLQLSGVDTDVTRDLDANYPLTYTLGIAQPSKLVAVADTGTCTFALRNGNNNSARTAGYYSLWHASKRTGFDFNCAVKVYLNFGGGGDFPVWVGRL